MFTWGPLRALKGAVVSILTERDLGAPGRRKEGGRKGDSFLVGQSPLRCVPLLQSCVPGLLSLWGLFGGCGKKP